MALSLLDIREGCIVDHTYERGEDGKLRLRPIRRRGIIVKVVGNGRDAVSQINVQFKPEGKPETVQGIELVRVYPATSKVARRALARMRGQHELVGAEFAERQAPVKPKLEDSIGLTKGRPSPFVEPEEGSEETE